MVFLPFLTEMTTAPVDELLELGWGRNPVPARHLKLEPGQNLDAGPVRPRDLLGHDLRGGQLLLGANRSPNLVERESALLQSLYTQKLLEMGAIIPRAPAQTVRRGDETLLDVVTNGAPRNAAEVGQLTD
ncbi:MAG TPA: hypothetical protein VLK65_00855 [Vicinamibacteria bacterium]|nr:hypothetical protein [Vicinamibacteria bacterium]